MGRCSGWRCRRTGMIFPFLLLMKASPVQVVMLVVFTLRRGSSAESERSLWKAAASTRVKLRAALPSQTDVSLNQEPMSVFAPQASLPFDDLHSAHQLPKTVSAPLERILLLPVCFRGSKKPPIEVSWGIVRRVVANELCFWRFLHTPTSTHQCHPLTFVPSALSATIHLQARSELCASERSGGS